MASRRSTRRAGGRTREDGDGRAQESRADHGSATRTARSTITARIRAARSVKARSKRAGCGARGTGTTTTRSPALPRRASPTRPSASRSTSAPTASTSSCRWNCRASERCPTSWWRRCARGASRTCSGWSDTRTSGSRTRCASAEVRGDLTFIGIRHEGAAAFAASAYGKLTGRLAACFAIAGPGSTNLLTGLYDAKVDRAPVLALSGQVPSKVRGRGAFQDLDLGAVVRRRRGVHADCPGRLRPCGADEPRVQARDRATGSQSSRPSGRGADAPRG